MSLIGGSIGNDTLSGDLGGIVADDSIFGFGGDDVLSGGYGNDSLDGGADADTLSGGAGNDTLAGGTGADVFKVDADFAGSASHTDTLADFSHADLDRIDVSALGISDFATVQQLLSSAAGNSFLIYLSNGYEQKTQLTGLADFTTLTASDFVFSVASGDDGRNGFNGADDMFGGLGNDWLSGGLGDDRLFGEDGGDVLEGQQGSDTLSGGAGNDSLAGSLANQSVLIPDGNDVLAGGAGNDTLAGWNGDDSLDGGTEADTLSGGFGFDTLYGGDGADLLNGDADDDFLDGGADADTLNGGSGNNSLYGGGGADLLTSGGFDDILDGGTEADTLLGGYGLDTLTGGSGADVFGVFASGTLTDFSRAQHDRLDVSALGIAEFATVRQLLSSAAGNSFLTYLYDDYSLATQLTGLADFTTLTPADFVFSTVVTDDVRTGNDGADDLFGGLGNDSLSGVDGNDRLWGEAGNDTLRGGNGFDTLVGGGGADLLAGDDWNDVLDGGSGNDTLAGGREDDSLTGGAGADLFVVDAYFSGAQTDTFADFSRAQLDRIDLSALGISDFATVQQLLSSAGGDSFLVYHRWSDAQTTQITGLADFTTLTAAAFVLSTVGTNDNKSGLPGADDLFGGLGNDTLDGIGGDDHLFGEAGDDVLVGGDADAFDGTNDTLSGGAGNDALNGQKGYDLLEGGTGADTLTGGLDDDTLTGGTGADVFAVDLGYVYGGTQTDTFTDFSRVQHDRLDVSALGISEFATVQQLLSSAGGDSFLTWFERGVENTSQLSGLTDSTTLTAADFVFNAVSNDSNISGTIYRDDLFGGLGNDTLSGHYDEDRLFGEAGNDVLTGGAGTYSWPGTNDTLWGGAGNDTLNGDYGDTLDAYPGDDVLLGGSGIDELNGGAGNDSLDGGTGTDLLRGNSGDDTLDGGAGADVLVGGYGSDTYVVDTTADTIDETGYPSYSETDLVQASVTFSLSAVAGIENLTLIGSAAISGNGDTLANVLTGNAGDNTLRGYDGADRLSGGGGVDTLIGGVGDDTYVVDTATDTITETAAGETDLVESSITFSLAGIAKVENLTLIGAAAINGTGSTLANVLTGNDGYNVLSGVDGADTLSGGGGIDTLRGGVGNDTYVVDTATDTITEAAGSGTDLVASSITFSLTGIANVENLTLIGAAAINGTGSTLANVLTGNDANNVLSGVDGADTLSGGGGIDTLRGGLGNDTFLVDTTTDTITETAAGGTDLVQAGFTFSLAALANVENLTLTGSEAIDGTGNTLANVLTGNSSVNVLDGGAGADTLIGGAGDDVYTLNDTADSIVEAPGSGNDQVVSSVTFSLAGIANVEQLVLAGTASIDGTGNGLANVIVANAGDNVIDGGAGIDAASYRDAGNAVNVSLAIAGAQSIAGSGSDRFLRIEGLFGSGFDDTLSGNAADNVLRGFGGNDTLTGGGGADAFGVDSSVGGVSQTDVLVDFSLAQHDRLDVSALGIAEFATVQELLSSAGGDSFLVYRSSGSDQTTQITGLTDSTTLTAADFVFSAAATDDYIYGALGDASDLFGGLGNDTVYGSAYDSDRLFGEAGNDELMGIFGDDTLSGGAGDDLLYADYFNILYGIGGNDVLTGGSGNDTLYGVGGNDSLDGGTESDTLVGSDGNDWMNGGAGADSLDGGAGTNRLSYAGSSAVTVNLETLSASGGDAAGDTISGFQDLTGSGNGDSLTGSSGANAIDGGDGGDTINGGAGIDTLIGGAGNDIFVVDTTTDTITETAGGGTDRVNSNVTFSLAALTQVENLTLTGAAAINGTGNALANVLTGNTGNNSLNGGNGADTLIGGVGADTLSGGAAADHFDFNALTELGIGASRDVITDFSSAQLDKIDLSTIDADPLTAGDQAFVLVESFTTAGAQVRFSGAILYLNTDTDIAAEYQIAMNGVASIAASDLIL